MAGYDRVIDPITRDYVRNDATASVEKTRTALTAIYHQIKTELGQWWGDPDAGSRLHTLNRAKNLLSSPIVVRDVFTRALQPLVDDGRITAPVFESERLTDRVNISVTVTDLQSGEQLEITDLLPFEP